MIAENDPVVKTTPELVFSADQIRPLVERVAAKYPAARSAAVDAFGLLLAGQVQPLAPTPLFRDDRWRAGGVVCSIKGQRCECGAAVAQDDNGGPLCQHRLAAMFARILHKAHGARCPRLEDVLRLGQGAGLRLYVRVMFTYDVREEQGNVCTGYFVEGGTVQRFEDWGDQFRFTFDELAGELFAAGYMLGKKAKMAGGSAAWRNEAWDLVPAQAGVDLMAATHAGAAAANPAGFVPRRVQVGRMVREVGV